MSTETMSTRSQSGVLEQRSHRAEVPPIRRLLTNATADECPTCTYPEDMLDGRRPHYWVTGNPDQGEPLSMTRRLDATADVLTYAVPVTTGSANVLGTAARIMKAAVEKTDKPEIEFEAEGILSIDIRLDDQRLLVARLDYTGKLTANIYNDEEGTWLEHRPNIAEAELIDLF